MIRSVKLLALLAAIALLSVGAGCGGSGNDTTNTTVASLRPIQGTWGGELRQSGLAPFRVLVTIASATDSSANPVHYGGIDCGGHWTYLGKSGASYGFREVIDSGSDSECKGVGQVTITPRDNRLGYEFRGDGVESRGTLQPIAEASP